MSGYERGDREETTGMRTYYVSLEGSDDDGGLSIERPWRTIQRAAGAMRAGDRCIVRGGTYRETVRPSASGREGAPIRFEAYPGERVVVSGCDPVGRWSPLGGGVYEGEMEWSMQDGCGDIVFVDGALCHEAAWPHIADRLDRSSYATVDASTCEGETWTIFDEDLLQFPDGYWTGAIVGCLHGVAYFMSTAKVTDFRNGTLYFDAWVSSAQHYWTTPGDLYVLTRSPQALAAGEGWYRDADAGRLRLRLPDESSPEGREVEAKRREYAFDLTGRAWIEVAGFEIRAASITTQGAEHCRIDGVRIYGIDRYFGDRQSIYGRTKGVELGGSDNALLNSEVAFFEGIGVNLSGLRNRVVNCWIHDGNLEASYASLVWATGSEHLVSRSTIERSGRTCVSGVFSRSVIQYCDIGHANLLTKDSGIIYLFNHDFDNTDIHHNWLHDNESTHLSFGFYMDAWTSGVNLYKNVVWNVPHHGLHLNRPLQRTLIYNNTFLRSGDAASSIFLFDDMYGVQMANNIFSEGTLLRWGEDCLDSHNLFGVDGGFVDADRRDFRLRPDSPAYAAGMPLSGVTSGPGGKRPDLGAYETGEPYWIPGHDFSRSTDDDVLVFSSLASKSVLGNCGFETGGWAPWRTAAGAPQLVFECAWDYSRDGYRSVVRSNKYAAMLAPGDRIEQTVTGLAPNTRYELWFGVKSDGRFRSADSYDDIHASAPLDQAPDGGCAIYRDVRYVGSLHAGDWLLYRGVDFGHPGTFDHIAVGMTKLIGPIKLEVRLDRPDGERIAVISQEDDYDGVWRYFASPIRPAAGMRDVYFVAAGPGRLWISGFKTYHGTAASPAEIAVVAASGERLAARSVLRREWEAKMSKLAFATGPEQTEATIAVSNPKGPYFVYLDDFGLWRPDPA